MAQQDLKTGFSKPAMVPFVRPWLIKGNGYEEKLQTLLYVFVSIFGLDRAQTTKGSEMCWSN